MGRPREISRHQARLSPRKKRKDRIMKIVLAAMAACVALLGGCASSSNTSAARQSHMVSYDNVQIEVVAEGRGPLVVMLPSLGRDSDDYGPVAEAFVRDGYRVLRPA